MWFVRRPTTSVLLLTLYLYLKYEKPQYILVLSQRRYSTGHE